MALFSEPRLIAALPRSGGGRLTAALIGVTTLLMALAVAGAFSLDRAASGMVAGLGRGATLLVVAADPVAREAQAEAAARLLTRAPEVERARRLSEADLGALLSPWIGAETVAAGGLPLPILFDVTLRAGADPETLRGRLRAAVPAARLDVHAQWMGPLAGMLRALETLGIAIVGIVGLATVAVVALGVRTALAAQRDTLDLLHVMGADDAAIAGLFQYRYLRLGLAGGGVGALCGAGVVAVFSAWAAAAGLGAGVPLATWGALLLLPLAAGLLAMLAARIAAQRTLRNLT
jgi:cell division transport system permease protein